MGLLRVPCGTYAASEPGSNTSGTTSPSSKDGYTSRNVLPMRTCTDTLPARTMYIMSDRSPVVNTAHTRSAREEGHGHLYLILYWDTRLVSDNLADWPLKACAPLSPVSNSFTEMSLHTIARAAGGSTLQKGRGASARMMLMTSSGVRAVELAGEFELGKMQVELRKPVNAQHVFSTPSPHQRAACNRESTLQSGRDY